MLATVFKLGLKLQSGLWYPRVEVEQRTHSGDEIVRVLVSFA